MSRNELCIPESNDDLSVLVERARTLMENARSAATRSGYARDVSDYEFFCRAHGLIALPPSAPVIALYLAELSTRMRPATIARRMAAIADRSKRAGYGTEALRSFAVQEVWKGIRRTLGIAPVVKAPLTASAIREVARACPDTLIGRRDRVLALVGYAGGFRRSELAAIKLSHLTFEPDSVGIPDSVNIYVPRSKTDQVIGASRDTDPPCRALATYSIPADQHPVHMYPAGAAHGSNFGLIAPAGRSHADHGHHTGIYRIGRSMPVRCYANNSATSSLAGPALAVPVWVPIERVSHRERSTGTQNSSAAQISDVAHICSSA